jgi:hypothetical protein
MSGADEGTIAISVSHNASGESIIIKWRLKL